MAITHGALSTRSSVASWTLDISSIPVGAAMAVSVNAGSNSASFNLPSTGTGTWTQRVAPFNLGSRRAVVWTKDKTSSSETTLTLSTAAAHTTATMLYWSTGSVAAADFVFGTVGVRAVATTPTNPAPSVTTTVDASEVVVWSWEATTTDETDSQITVNNGFTKLAYGAQASGIIETTALATKIISPAGATGITTYTYPNAAGGTNGASVHMVVAPIAAPDPIGPGVAVKRKTANPAVLEDRKLYVKTANGLRTPVVRFLKPGSTSVTALQAKPGFKVAHRMGSLNWPEHTMKGASQSLLRQVDALEFSVAITSDGKWFGLHDATLDRTSGVTGNIDPKTLTWAQILANYQSISSITDDPSQPNQPYVLLTDILARYPGVPMFIDPKNLAFTDMVALFQWLKTNIPNATDLFVLKYYYDYTALKNAVMDLGFKSWGYLYTADIANANFATYCQRWTWLGLESSATQANWDLVKAQNPNVLVHICQTLAAYQAGISKGAVGAMVSGVRQVMGF